MIVGYLSFTKPSGAFFGRAARFKQKNSSPQAGLPLEYIGSMRTPIHLKCSVADTFPVFKSLTAPLNGTNATTLFCDILNSVNPL